MLFLMSQNYKCLKELLWSGTRCVNNFLEQIHSRSILTGISADSRNTEATILEVCMERVFNKLRSGYINFLQATLQYPVELILEKASTLVKPVVAPQEWKIGM